MARSMARLDAARMLSAVDKRPADDFEHVRLILARQRQLGASFEDAWAMVF